MKQVQVLSVFIIIFSIAYAVTQQDVDLFNAVIRGDVGTVRKLIVQKAAVNIVKKKDKLSPLHIAENLTIVQELIKAGADIHAQALDGSTPLFSAVVHNNNAKARYLLDKGAKVNIQVKIDSEIYTPLRWAAEENNYEIVLALLKKEAEFSDELIKNLYSIDNYDIADLLESYKEFNELSKEELNALNKDGFARVHTAVALKYPVKLDALVLAGASLNTTNAKFGRTPLHMAVVRNFAGIVQKLIDYGADINLVDAQGDTPLDLAYKFNRAPIIVVLKKRGAVTNRYTKIAPLLDALLHLKNSFDQLFDTLEYIELYA